MRCHVCRRQVEDGTYVHRNGRPAKQILHDSMGTLSDSVVPAVIGLEVGSQLLHTGVTVFLCDYALIIEDDCFVPLTICRLYLSLLLQLGAQLTTIQRGLDHYLNIYDIYAVIFINRNIK